MMLTGCGGQGAAPSPPQQALLAFTTACPHADGSPAQTFTVAWDPNSHKYVNIADLVPIPSHDGAKAALPDPRPGIGQWADAIYNRSLHPDADQTDHDMNWQWTSDGKSLVDVTGDTDASGHTTWIDVKDASTGAVHHYDLPHEMTTGDVHPDDLANWGLSDDNRILIDSPIGADAPDKTVVWTLDLKGKLLDKQQVPARGLPIGAEFAFPIDTFAANGLQTTEFSPDGRYLVLNPNKDLPSRLPDDTRFAVYDLVSHRYTGKVPIPIGWIDSTHLVDAEQHALVIRGIDGKRVRSTLIALPTGAIGCKPPSIDGLLYVPAGPVPGAFAF